MTARTVRLSVQGVCRGRGPQPSHADCRMLLDRLEDQLALFGAKAAPFALEVAAWPIDGRRFFARVLIEVDPAGDRRLPLRAWYQWRHPRWNFSHAPRPADAPQPDQVPA